jgi:hypothetical protein
MMKAIVGDIWHKVEGSHVGEEVYRGMELSWTTWRCVSVTPKGAWFRCVEWSYKKPRFALTDGARSLSRTKHEALQQLIRKKVLHLRILENEMVVAQDTLRIARATLAEMSNG